MPSLLLHLVVAIAAVWSFVTPAAAEKRVALVIGNGAYQHTQRLLNPKNDAEDVSAALRRTGFDTIVGLDLDRAGMENATIRFARAARDADVAIFYFSGHAMQFNGVNYLMPVDASLTDEADLRRMARIDEIVADLQQARNLRILVLDSCRDNPLAEQLKRRIGTTRSASIGRGLAKIDSPQGMILAFSTQAGSVAADGRGRNSPYTAAFLKHIEAAEEIGTVFRRMSADVYEATKRTQLPELSLSLIGEFYLKGRPAAAPQAAPDVTALQERLRALEEQIRKKDEPKVAVGTFPERPEAAPQRRYKPGDTFKECELCPEMVVVSAGSFAMGSPASEKGRSTDEGPQHRVAFARPFAVGKFAVTFDQWDACVADGGCGGYRPADQAWGRGKRPVINVSWDDAKAYLAWLSRRTGKTYRLPSEAEREYVARAGTTTPFWWGATISSQQANYDGTSTYGDGRKGEYRRRTLPVDSFQPNPFGLYQVHGNVWEWMEDCWNGSYAGAPADGSAWTAGDCGRRVLRGGSWNYYPEALRSADRDASTSSYRGIYNGFRVARSLD
ncbi:MAG: SUMF1/EgtB/PvdO family nonheme iron enzyme [Pseudorhodoplanes sp.]|uniref:SUMF1/EgtB/PvdO family nonheme iron enzyme n=1 Tax=Pseudorhodoplanes sp. TaxID=1934341 RepID=UPI003D0E395F